MNIAVYCSARSGLPEAITDDARTLGQWIGRNNNTLVYGGLKMGLMDVVASEASKNGATVIGVVPQSRMQLQHPANNVNIHVASLHERKQTMEENANLFVALDGGYGTLDEIMSALASSSFFSEPKPILLLNRDNLFTPLRDMMDEMTHRGLLIPDRVTPFELCPDIESLIKRLDYYQTNLNI